MFTSDSLTPERQIVDRLLNGMIDCSSNAQDPRVKEIQGYSYISSDPEKFRECIAKACNIFVAANDRKPKSFLDVGCGLGITLLMAAKIFPETHGIELDKKYVNLIKRKIIDHGDRRFDTVAKRIKVFNKNALTFKDYDKYDVIYFYRPIRGDLEEELEHSIFDGAKKNAVIVANGTIRTRSDLSRMFSGLDLEKDTPIFVKRFGKTCPSCHDNYDNYDNSRRIYPCRDDFHKCRRCYRIYSGYKEKCKSCKEKE